MPLHQILVTIIVAVCTGAADWDFRAVLMQKFAKNLLRDSGLRSDRAGTMNVSFCALANKTAATDRGAKRA